MIGFFLLQIILWTFAIYGITQIITEATIFEGLRNRLENVKFFGKLVSCFLCASVWISFVLSAWIFSPASTMWTYLSTIESIFIDGMIGSTIVWFLHIYENK